MTMIFLNTRIHTLSLCLISAVALSAPASAQVINPYPIEAPAAHAPEGEPAVVETEQAPVPLVQVDDNWQEKSPGLTADELNNREWQLLQRIQNSQPAAEPSQEALAAPEPVPVTEHEMQQIEAEVTATLPAPQSAPEPEVAHEREPVIYNDDQWERKVEQETAAAQRAPEPEFMPEPPQAELEEVVVEEVAEFEQPPVQYEPQQQPVAADGWAAQEGENMRDVLARWSDRAGVTFVWDTRNQFAVLESVNFDVTYESAVRNLLNQYQEDQVRPYGILNVEPNTGGRTLTIDSGENAPAG